MSGETMYYGSGAGKLPTAAAVVGDIIDEVKSKGTHKAIDWNVDETIHVLSADKSEVKCFVRVAFIKIKKQPKQLLKKYLAQINLQEIPEAEGEFAFLTGKETEKSMNEKRDILSADNSVKEVINIIRVEE